MKQRIAIMPGCVQGALAPQIDGAVGRVLARRGIELVALDGAGCCGALPHHMGRDRIPRPGPRRRSSRSNRASTTALLITATGCSSQLKDYAHQFAGDLVWEPRAARFAACARDFAELCTPLTVTPQQPLRVAYHPACSLQNSLKLNGVGEALLEAAGFMVTPFAESHLCCGSAGTYSILQPELSGQLRARKLGNIAAAEPTCWSAAISVACSIWRRAKDLTSPSCISRNCWIGQKAVRNPPIWNCPASRIKVAPCAARLSFPCCFFPARLMP